MLATHMHTNHVIVIIFTRCSTVSLIARSLFSHPRAVFFYRSATNSLCYTIMLNCFFSIIPNFTENMLESALLYAR